MVVQLIKYGLHRFPSCNNEGIDEEKFPPFQLKELQRKGKQLYGSDFPGISGDNPTLLPCYLYMVSIFHRQSLTAIVCKTFPFKVPKKETLKSKWQNFIEDKNSGPFFF